MDPVTLIVSALAAGAAAALKETAGTAVRDAYAGLKGLLQRKLASSPAGVVALEQHEAEPDAWGGALKKELEKANVAQDEEVVAAARLLLEAADPAGSARGKYNVTVTNSTIGIIGDNGYVDQSTHIKE
jgi:hypothetical protein